MFKTFRKGFRRVFRRSDPLAHSPASHQDAWSFGALASYQPLPQVSRAAPQSAAQAPQWTGQPQQWTTAAPQWANQWTHAFVQFAPQPIRPMAYHGAPVLRAARPSQVFTLQTDANGKYVLGRSRQRGICFGVPELKGLFRFVIYPEEPYTVYVAATEYSDVCRDGDTDWEVDSHFAITNGRSVLFAGTLFVLDGHLAYWTAQSSDYDIPPHLRFTNLTPQVNTLLPSHIFC